MHNKLKGDPSCLYLLPVDFQILYERSAVQMLLLHFSFTAQHICVLSYHNQRKAFPSASWFVQDAIPSIDTLGQPDVSEVSKSRWAPQGVEMDAS